MVAAPTPLPTLPNPLMSLPQNQAWFRAKTYGCGWGLPSRLQGWLVMLVYFAALLWGTL